ncbi:MAG: ribonuclease P protein component [Candidatus Cloacimonetes bacterium]|nr:ribonuclease P protein component [Candidatus Cloacimonadota bacterium]
MLRVTSTKDYALLRQSSAKIIGKYFIIVYLQDNKSSESSAGITVSRKIGNAVTRNRVKRRVKAFLQCYDLTSDCFPFMCNIIALPSIVEAKWLSMCKDLERAIQKVQMSCLNGKS